MNTHTFYQTRATVSEALRQNKYSSILVLSLGTGTPEFDEIWDAEMAATWGNLEWLIAGIIFLDRATTSMAEYYHDSLFQQPAITYLRIQVYMYLFNCRNRFELV